VNAEMSWHAAVLRPRDIAPHPNFMSSEAPSSQGLLALLVLGRHFDFARLTDPLASPESGQQQIWEANNELSASMLRMANASLSFGSVREGADGLAKVAADAQDDGLRTAASLLAAVAYAECDDYSACLSVLALAVATVSKENGLCAAALRLQQSLRRRDCSDSDGVAEALQAATLIETLEEPTSSEFAVSRGVSWTSEETLRLIREGLATSALAASVDFSREISGDGQPRVTWEDVVRRQPSITELQAAALRAMGYEAFVADLFKARTGGTGLGEWRFGSSDDDQYVWAAELQDELYGRPSARQSRLRLAQLRALNLPPSPTTAAGQDVLRLLRHSSDAAALASAIRWMQAGGPLSAVQEDALQILRNRLHPPRVGKGELTVLRAAAVLLDEPTAAHAFRELLPSAGADLDTPGHWSARSSDLEASWPAVAALGAAGGLNEEACTALVGAAAQEPEDPLIDRAFLAAAWELDWTGLSTPTSQACRQRLSDQTWPHPGLAEHVLSQLGVNPVSAIPRGEDADFELIAQSLNATMRGATFPPELLPHAVKLARDALRSVRKEASEGRYGFGAASPADLAVGLSIYAETLDLWPSLVEFLTDPSVGRAETSAAFERLAVTPAAVPADVAAALHASLDSILFRTFEHFGPAPSPYPAALRCFIALGVLDDAQAMLFCAQLAGSGGPSGRHEAARTVVAACRTAHPASWLPAFALQYSYDEVTEVRAEAGRGLGLLLGVDAGPGVAVEQRLTELLAEDGLLIPLLALRGLEELNRSLGASVSAVVEVQANEHQARSVREAARRALGQ